jgi:hypothetical protein
MWPFLRVYLRRIGEQVDHDLLHPTRIYISQSGSAGSDTERECSWPSTAARAGPPVHLHDPAEVGALSAEVHSSGRDASDFEQIVDQQRQLLHLAFDDDRGLLMKG